MAEVLVKKGREMQSTRMTFIAPSNILGYGITILRDQCPCGKFEEILSARMKLITPLNARLLTYYFA